MARVGPQRHKKEGRKEGRMKKRKDMRSLNKGEMIYEHY
jgi:hypothetical protein